MARWLKNGSDIEGAAGRNAVKFFAIVARRMWVSAARRDLPQRSGQGRVMTECTSMAAILTLSGHGRFLSAAVDGLLIRSLLAANGTSLWETANERGG